MKKLRYISVFIFLVSGGSLAILNSCRPYIDDVPVKPPVDLVCQLNITGGCLDQWIWANDGHGFFCLEPQGGFLHTLNYLTTLPEAAGGPGPLTTDSTRDSYSGRYAAILTTASFSPQGSPILIPGIIGTDSLDIPNATILLGKGYTSRPHKFNGYYKYQPVSGDSGIILVLLSKFNTVAHHRDTVAFARQIIKNAVSTYTLIDLPINYFSSAIPDSLTLIIASSGEINFVDLMGSRGQVGSRLWIDEIQFDKP
jgi:hypothetical protein